MSNRHRCHAIVRYGSTQVKPATYAFERAKDVAAFANHLGGTLLIGAQELNGQLQAYVGMPPTDAGAVRNDYSKAVADRCMPRPTIDFEEYDDPGDPAKRIVAINVEPSLNLVGVKISGDKDKEGYGGIAYVFPVRSGIDARYLESGQLAMFMTPHVRRVAVLLSKIPQGTFRLSNPEIVTVHLASGKKVRFFARYRIHMFSEHPIATRLRERAARGG
jgi:hypothetical protein